MIGATYIGPNSKVRKDLALFSQDDVKAGESGNEKHNKDATKTYELNEVNNTFSACEHGFIPWCVAMGATCLSTPAAFYNYNYMRPFYKLARLFETSAF